LFHTGLRFVLSLARLDASSPLRFEVSDRAAAAALVYEYEGSSKASHKCAKQTLVPTLEILVLYSMSHRLAIAAGVRVPDTAPDISHVD
jgi:hypothetical protein